jgi:hypothetical protein
VETVCSSKMLVGFKWTTWHYIPVDNIHLHSISITYFSIFKFFSLTSVTAMSSATRYYVLVTITLFKLCIFWTHIQPSLTVREPRNSIVGIATGYRLDDIGVGVQVLVGSRIFLPEVVQTGYGAHTASYPSNRLGIVTHLPSKYHAMDND